jgi:trans-aconitate methyltransferase
VRQSFWRATGIKACHDLLRALTPHIDLDEVRRLLDWGCSAGRVTVHLIDRFPQAEVFGTDIDVEAVEWASRNLTGGRFTPCHRDPPLPYPDSYFDLVVAVSVFTHLTRAYQEQWLKELQRVTAANAIVVASTHGEPACRWMFHQPGEWEKRMLTGFSDEIQDNGLGPVASGDYYRGTFQTVAYTRELWGQYFDVIVHDEGGLSNLQDIYVLRKKASAR